MIAEKFSDTRKNFWRDLEFIADYPKEGDQVLDYGCGNGRLLNLLSRKKADYFGVDVSAELIGKAKEKFPEASLKFSKISIQGSLPFPNDFFNAVFSVAVFHHFPPVHAEIVAKELFRVTRPGGKAIITVWNLWQRKYWKYIFGPRIIFDKVFQRGEYVDMGFGDVFIPFKDNDGKIFERYHRAYSQRELKRVFSRAGFLVEGCFLKGGKNIVLVAGKEK